MTRSLLAAALVVAAIVPAFAAAPEPTQAAPEFSELMAGFEGTWKCETRRPPAGAADAQVVKSTIKIGKEKQMNGLWYRGEHTIAKTGDAPEKRGVFLIGWDPDAREAVVTTYNNNGGASLLAGSVTGEMMYLTGDVRMNGKVVKARETMSRLPDQSLVQKFEADLGDGFVSMGENVCRR